jgi:O-antigen/teichoic acid export membrane protein
MAEKNKIKHLSFYMLAQGISILVPFIAMPIYTRMIPPNDYGILDMFQIVMIIGLGLGNWGMQSAFDRYFFAYPGETQKQKRLLGTVVTFTVICLVFVTVIIFLFRNPISNLLTHSNRWTSILLLILISGYIDYLNAFFFAYFRNAEQASHYIRYDIGKSIVSLLVGLTLVALFKMGIFGLALTNVISGGIVLIALIGRFGFREIFKIDTSMLRESFAFGWPLMSKVMLGILNISIDKLMVGTIGSLNALGIYGRAQRISYGIFTIMVTVGNVYAPRWNTLIFENTQDSAVKLSRLFTEYVSITIIPAILLSIFCQELGFILFPKEFYPAISLIVLLSFHYGYMSVGRLVGAIMMYLKMTKFTAVMTLLGYPINIVGNLFLIPKFGALGSVISTIVLGLITTFVNVAVVFHRYHFRFELKPLIFLFGMLIVSVVISLIAFQGALAYPFGLTIRTIILIVFAIGWVQIVGPNKIGTLLNKFLQKTNIGRKSAVQ